MKAQTAEWKAITEELNQMGSARKREADWKECFTNMKMKVNMKLKVNGLLIQNNIVTFSYNLSK